MPQRLTIILTIVVILAVLVLVNTLTYVQQQTLDDTELVANRSPAGGDGYTQGQRAWAKRVREADGIAAVGAGTWGVEAVEAGLVSWR